MSTEPKLPPAPLLSHKRLDLLRDMHTYGLQCFEAGRQQGCTAEPVAQWVSVDERLPEEETPVLILYCGAVRIGELRWDHPGFEDTYRSYRYWDNPNDEGMEWGYNDVTHWIDLPAPPAAAKGGE